MKDHPKPRPSTPDEQHQRFVDAAKRAGASEDADAFDDMLKRVTSAPPPKSVKGRKTKKPSE